MTVDDTLPAPAPAMRPDRPRTPVDADDYRDLARVDDAHYAIEHEIARGGMGRVFSARDRRLGRRVAIKELLAYDAALAVRFEREARLTARLSHPAIVGVHEAGRWPSGTPFYAMRLVTGVPLDKLIAAAPDLAARLALVPNALAVVDALAYAHAERIIHRDLKPSNVMCGAFGETVVIDWGLAKDLAATHEDTGDPYRSPGHSGDTVTGAVMGTPAYMPPEQAAGAPVDERADVYALGALLYHVLAGRPPFEAPDMVSLLAKVCRDRVPPLGEIQPDVPADLCAIVDKAMARDPAERFPTAREMAVELQRFHTGQLVSVHRYSLGELARRWLRRHRAAVATGGVLVAALAVVAVVSVRRVVEARDLAEERGAALLEDQGRQELLAGHPARALPYLEAAWGAGRRTASLEQLRGEARPVVDDVVRTVNTGAAPVTRIALTAAGDVVALTNDGTLRLWRADGSAGPPIALGPRPGKRTLLATADGATAVVIGGALTLCDLRTGTTTAIDGPGEHAALDGDRVIAWADGQMRLWDLHGRAIATVSHVTWAGFGTWHGQRIIAALDEFERGVELRMLDAATGSPLSTWTLATHRAVAEISGGWAIAVAEADGGYSDEYRIDAIQLETGASIKLSATVPSGSHMVARGSRLYLYGEHRIATIDLAERRVIGLSPLFVDVSDVVPFTVDGRDAIAVEAGDRAFVLDGETGARIAVLEGHASHYTALSAAGALAATGGADGRVVVWRPRDRITGRAPGRAVAVSPDGARIAYLADGALRITGDPPVEVRAPGIRAAVVAWPTLATAIIDDDHHLHLGAKQVPGTVTSCAFDPSGERLAASDGRVVRIVTAQGAPVATLEGHGDTITELQWSPDGTRLVSTGDRGEVRLWDVASTTGFVLETGHGAARAIAIAGDRIAIAGADAKIRIYDLAGKRLIERGDEWPTALALSSDGRMVASGGADGLIGVWATDDGREIATADQSAPVKGLAFRGDGALLASAGNTQSWLWNARTGAQLAERDQGGAVAFVGDGQLATIGARSAAVWRTPPPAEGAASGPWRLEDGRLAAVVASRPLTNPEPRVLPVPADSLEGRVPGPVLSIAVVDHSADERMLVRVRALIDAGDHTAAAKLAAGIDGARLRRADLLDTLAAARFYAGDADAALTWAIAATRFDRRAAHDVVAYAPGARAAPADAMGALPPAELDHLARAYVAEGREAAALEVLDAQIAAGRGGEALLVKASLALAADRPAEAARHALAALEADPGLARAVASGARELYKLFTGTRDPRYGEAARSLLRKLITPDVSAELRSDLAAMDARMLASDGLDASTGRDSALTFTVPGHWAQLVACYERALASSPALTGTVTLRVEITAIGTATAVAPTVDPSLAGVAACFAERVRAWRFIARRPVTIDYPLKLHPVSSAHAASGDQ